MTNEIKEILDNIKTVIDEEHYRATCDIDYEDCKILLDYITNLQEELKEEKRIEQESLKTIQELEEKLYNLTHTIFTGRNYNEVLKSEQDYKSRNKKAMEYINHEIFKRTILVGVGTKKYTRNILDNVLNILKGEDK